MVKGVDKIKKFFFAFLETTNISKIYGEKENFHISLLVPEIEHLNFPFYWSVGQSTIFM